MIPSCSPTGRVHRSCREKPVRSTECGAASQVQVFFPALRTLIATSFFKWTRRPRRGSPLPPRLPRTPFLDCGQTIEYLAKTESLTLGTFCSGNPPDAVLYFALPSPRVTPPYGGAYDQESSRRTKYSRSSRNHIFH